MRASTKVGSVLFIATVVLAGTTGPALAQSSNSHLGIAVKQSTLGIAIEAAVPVGDKLNVRGGFNVFSLSHQFDSDGKIFAASLNMQSADVYLDWFPFGGGFHISPGVLFYNGNKVSGTYTVPAGSDFSLNDQQYISDPKNPVTGTGAVTLGKAGPALLLGWGNIVPRGSRRWSIPFEFGVVSIGSPELTLNLTGNACATNGSNCKPISTDATLQAQVAAEQSKQNSDLSKLKIYPVIAAGFSYKF